MTFPGYAGGENQSWRRISDLPRVIRFVLLPLPPPQQKSFCCSPHPMLTGLGLWAIPIFSCLLSCSWNLTSVSVYSLGAGKLKILNSPCHLPRALSSAAWELSTRACNIFIMALLLKVSISPSCLNSKVIFMLLPAERMILHQYFWASILVGKAGQAL